MPLELTAGDILRSTPESIVIKGDNGTNTNDVIINTNKGPIEDYHYWTISSTAGVVDVFIDTGSGEFTSAGMSLQDQGGIDSSVPVLVTVADRVYSFYGNFDKIRVDQNGATAAVNVYLRGHKT